MSEFITNISPAITFFAILASLYVFIVPEKYKNKKHIGLLYKLCLWLAGLFMLEFIVEIGRYIFSFPDINRYLLNYFSSDSIKDLMSKAEIRYFSTFYMYFFICFVCICFVISFVKENFKSKRRDFVRELLYDKDKEFLSEKLHGNLKYKKKLRLYAGNEEYVTIPQDIVLLREKSFLNNSNLRTIEIHKNCFIEPGAFVNCNNLEKIVSKNENYVFENGILYWVDIIEKVKIKKEILFAVSSLTDYVIDENVEIIRKYAFANTKIKNLMLSKLPSFDSKENEFVKKLVIEEFAFYKCHNLKIIDIPENVSEIENYAFALCTSLSEINFAETNGIILLKIPLGCFYKCYNLKTVNWYSNIVEIGAYAFAFCRSLKTIYIGQLVSKIGESAFYNCVNLENINFTHRVFSHCRSIYNLNKLDNDVLFKSNAQIDNEILKEFEKNIEKIIDKCDSEKNIETYIDKFISKILFPTYNGIIENNYKLKIEEEAFSNCKKLKEVVIPNYVTEIGEGAFIMCVNIRQVEFEKGSEIEEIPLMCFFYCINLKKMVLPERLRNIEQQAFFCCEKLKNMSVSDNSKLKLNKISERAFAGCPLINKDFYESAENIAVNAFDN